LVLVDDALAEVQKRSRKSTLCWVAVFKRYGLAAGGSRCCGYSGLAGPEITVRAGLRTMSESQRSQIILYNSEYVVTNLNVRLFLGLS
jgi:hypothetical protein